MFLGADATETDEVRSRPCDPLRERLHAPPGKCYGTWSRRGLIGERVRVLHNGIDTLRFAAAAAPRHRSKSRNHCGSSGRRRDAPRERVADWDCTSEPPGGRARVRRRVAGVGARWWNGVGSRSDLALSTGRSAAHSKTPAGYDRRALLPHHWNLRSIAQIKIVDKKTLSERSRNYLTLQGNDH